MTQDLPTVYKKRSLEVSKKNPIKTVEKKIPIKENLIYEDVPGGEETTIDKVGSMMEAIERNEQGNLILPTNMTQDQVRQWATRFAEQVQGPQYRDDDREGKIFARVWGYAIIDGNQLYIGGSNTAATQSVDVAQLIWNEIFTYGRQTADEIKDNIKAIQPELLFVVINKMLQDKYLKRYVEKDGTNTLELVEEHIRNAFLEEKNKERLERLDPDTRFLLNELPPITSCLFELVNHQRQEKRISRILGTFQEYIKLRRAAEIVDADQAGNESDDDIEIRDVTNEDF